MLPKLTDQIDQLNLENRQKQNRLYRPAKLGDGKGRWQSNPYIPGYVLIREQAADGRLSTPRNVLLPNDINFQLKDGTSVRLGKNEQFQDIILGADTLQTLSSGQDPAALAGRMQSDSTRQAFLETLRLMVKTGLVFSLKGWNLFLNGVYYEFTFPDIAASAPSAGNMYYAVFGVLADLSDVEVKYSTQRLVTDLPLSAADVNEVAPTFSAGSTPVWAVTLIGGQTTFAQADIDNLIGVKDLRQVVNANDAGEIKLSSTALVDMNTATPTTLYTALTGTIITRVVVRKASTSLTTASYSFGWNSATFNDVIADAMHTELTGNTLYTILVPKVGAKAGVAAGTFKVLMNVLQGGVATTTMDVFGYFV